MDNSSVKVRFAPSPTGELHLGGARTALFNWLYAKKQGGQFFLRIEDTDLVRSKDEYTDQILEALKWLGLKWDEPLVYQSKRFDDYKVHVKALLESGQVYQCFCSKEVLQTVRDTGHYQYPGTCRELSGEEIKKRLNQGVGFTYRLRIPEGKTKYVDQIYGPITVDHKELDDFIVVRSNGSPTYNFTAVIDDHDMNITHVIRGEDHVSNTPKQILLYKALGYEIPTFAHLPMILGPDKKPLSKRHGAPGLQAFRKEGYLPESINNYLALLGWNPGTEDEIFSTKELAGVFNLSQVQKKGAVWDVNKLNWISGQHVMRTNTNIILESIREIEPNWGKGKDISYLVSIIEMLKERAKSLSEFVSQSYYFFNEPKIYDQSELKRGWPDNSVNELIKSMYTILSEITYWKREDIENTLKAFAQENKIGLGKIIMPTRLALCGGLKGPNVFDIMALLGKDSTLTRIKTALKELPQ